MCIAILLLFISIANAAESPKLSVGEPLPALKGEFLTSRKAELPAASSGKIALLAIGFTYDSRFAVEAWSNRFRKEFARNPRVTWFEIPMIGGMARMGKWFIDSGMRRGTPKELRENVITVFGGVDPWKKRLALENDRDAHLVLIDEAGIVRWTYREHLNANAINEAKFVELVAEVRRLASAMSSKN